MLLSGTISITLFSTNSTLTHNSNASTYAMAQSCTYMRWILDLISCFMFSSDLSDWVSAAAEFFINQSSVCGPGNARIAGARPECDEMLSSVLSVCSPWVGARSWLRVRQCPGAGALWLSKRPEWVRAGLIALAPVAGEAGQEAGEMRMAGGRA
jgi:hypothetical protein